MKTKISIIGMGRVGSATAYTVAHKRLADEIVVLDILKDLVEGHALDLAHSMAWDGQGKLSHGDYPDIQGSRIILVCAGTPRKPGMDRMELASTNASVIKDIAASIRKHAPDAIVITLTNPVDVMNYLVWKTTGFPRERVIGQGGVLDSLRFRWAISKTLGIHASEVEAYVLGEHGSSKVPVFSRILVNGKPKKLSISERMKVTEDMERSNEAVIKKKGATEFAPAQALTRMVEAIISDKKEAMPCSVVLKGEYGLNDVSLGVPVILGRNGMEKIEEWPLEHSEEASLARSAEIIKDMQAKV
jgi:L-lactate dehydrogenase